MPSAQWIQLVLIAILTLIAAVAVALAQREARAVRKAVAIESSEIREEARALLSQAQRREERLALREREIAEDQRNAAKYVREVEARVVVVAHDEKRLVAEHDRFAKEREKELGAIAELKPKDAKVEFLKQIKAGAQAEAAAEFRRIAKRLKDESSERAREVLVAAMQRQAGEATSQQSVTWINLPSEEMKGRIIGREGRNIRAFEALTGVNLIVEEGVDAVMVSSFDVERREIAVATLSALLEDGRIQPQRVEAAYAAAVASAPERNHDAGLDAAETAGVAGLGGDVIDALGRLRLRTSAGQNVLAHLVETAGIAAEIATTLEANQELARRAAFLHDIGKVYTGEREGTHAALGAALADQQGESAEVVNAIAAHHDEIEPATIEAVIVQIADAVSASRPGARRDDAEGYVERIGALEKELGAIDGVTEVYAMSAGREVRVAVEPDMIDDDQVAVLARTIAKRIDDDPKYPGEVKVTVIRETRADAVAG